MPKKKTTGTKTKKKRKTKKVAGKKKTVDKQSLKEIKSELDSLLTTINLTFSKLPSLIVDKTVEDQQTQELTFDMDAELVNMLEEFFSVLVMALKLRVKYNRNLVRISQQITKIKEIDKVVEFKGNLQILGITLRETERIINEYERKYNEILYEQAQLHYGMLEHLFSVQQGAFIDISSTFKGSIDAFERISNKIAELD